VQISLHGEKLTGSEFRAGDLNKKVESEITKKTEVRPQWYIKKVWKVQKENIGKEKLHICARIEGEYQLTLEPMVEGVCV